MDSIDILWPSGKKESYRNLPADFIYTIVEDTGIQKKVAFTRDSKQGEASAKSESKK
jgi:hypothetical protein